VRLTSTVVGILLVALGGVWIAQGLNVFPGQSFMNGDLKWAFYGGCVALGGLVLLAWTRRRPR
jgi:uncharacterized membrane protein